MRKNWISVALLACFTAGFVNAGEKEKGGSNREPPRKEGEKDEAKKDPNYAPGFTLKGVDGKDFNLDECKDKIVVLEWVNHGCPFVKRLYKG